MDPGRQDAGTPPPKEPVDEPSLRAKLLSGAKWSVALRLVTQTYKWLITLVMVRLLAPEDYGLNAMLEAPIEILALAGTLGIDAALIRFGVKDPTKLAASFGLLLLVNGFFFVALFAGAQAIAAYFKAPALEPLIRVAAVVFVLAPFRVVPNAILDMNLEFKLKAQVELKSTLLASFVGLVLALAGAGVWSLVAVVVLTSVLNAALLAWYRPWFVKPTLSLGSIRDLLSYGTVIIAGSLITLFAGKAYSVIGGPVVGPQALGAFAVATVFAYIPISKVLPIVQQTLYPAFAKLSSEPALVRKYVLNAVELAFILILPVGIGTAAVAETAVDVLFGDQWQAAALPLALLSLLTPVRLLNLLMHAPLNATGHASAVTLLAITNFAAAAAGVLLWAPFGTLGLVAAATVAAVLSTAAAQFCARKYLGISLRNLLRVIWHPTLASALMGAAVLVVAQATSAQWPRWLSLASCVAVGLITYLGLMQLLMGRRLRQIIQVLAGR